jgi:RNA polymerase sigma factor (sigma-70 family)
MDARAMAKDDPPGQPVVPFTLPVRSRSRIRALPDSRPVVRVEPDADLVRAACREPAVFGQLYERYFPIVYGYCHRRLDEPATAEDACAAIFSRAFASLGSCRHPDRFRSWLFTIAHHEITDRYRARESLADLDAVAHTLRDPARSPEDSAIAADERRAVRNAMRALPDDQRHVVELRLAGLTGPEIADIVGRRHGAIRALQHRAYGRLRTLLADLAPDEHTPSGHPTPPNPDRGDRR